MLGKMVNVTVDRPLGSFHPKHKNIVYPLNYGYVNGIIAPDGEEQDVYIMGVDMPIKEFTGRVVAVIRRINDVEDKWIVAPEGYTVTKEDIIKATFFQEQYFNIEIIL